MGRPETRYAVHRGDHIAYQLVGSGPIDIVFVPQWFSNVDALWDVPSLARFVEQLARFGRVLLFDKRGTGVSDALPDTTEPFLENFNEDLRAVLEAAGFDRPAIIAGDSAGLMAIVFAASHPERVSSMVLFSVYASLAEGDASLAEYYTEFILKLFEEGVGVELLVPTIARAIAMLRPCSRDFSGSPRARAPRSRRGVNCSRSTSVASSPQCNAPRS